MDDKDKYSKFKKLGKRKVRENITRGLYRPKNRKEAEAWLEQNDHEKSAELSRHKESSSPESKKITRSAKNAAWVAAIAMIAIVILAVIDLFSG